MTPSSATQWCGLFGIAFVLLVSPESMAEVKMEVESSLSGTFFRFDNVPLPAIDDAGAEAIWKVVAGQADTNSGSIKCLSDGQIPTSADQPAQNFFLAAGTKRGLISVDLGKLVDLTEIVTYSWHTDSRAPQVYVVYGSTGEETGFAVPVSSDEITKATGWDKIASVDTRRKDQSGGQHAVRIYDSDSNLGKFRYLLFEINETEPGNRFSHTFFSEIDLITADMQDVQRVSVPEVREIRFSTTDDQFRFTVDVTQALELEAWATEELKPVIREWYPRIVKLLPSEGFEAAKEVRFQFLRDAEMKGIPAYAVGTTISMNAEWFRGQLRGEARGAVVHEMVHIVQQYPGRNRRSRGTVPPPGWIVEGIPDYVRWFLYEPETGGAKLSTRALKDAKHDASYRTSANFIDWVIRSHPSNDSLLEQLNASARAGRYSTSTWKELTGKSEQELADAWRNQR